MEFIAFDSADIMAGDSGNKAARLAELTAAGFRVPAFFVIDPAAHRVAAESEPLRSAARRPEALSLELGAALRRLCTNGERVAVRSSSVEEDGAATSFAGQFDSFLNVELAEVDAHVASVWQSANSAHVQSYRETHGLTGTPATPAVIVQRMVDAEAAGVAFAADPVSGCRDHAVVAAGRGLGDALVSGECQGDTWRVGRRGRILGSDLADAANPVLTPRQVRRIAALARKASDHFGRPQDIEWALQSGRIHLLQSRDITSLASTVGDESYALWDNSNIVESYGGVTTPLTFSVARSAYAEAYRHFGRVIGISESVIAANDKTYEQMIGLIDGRVYYNLLNWYRLLMLTPGFRFNRRFMEQMMGVTQSLPDSAVPVPQSDTRFAPLRASLGLIRVSLRLTAKLLLHNRRVRRFHDRLAATLSPVETGDMSLEQLVDYYEALQAQVIPAWDTPLINDLYCMIFHGALRKLCERWLPAELAEVHNDLVCGESGIVSLEPVRRMRALADIARGSADLVAALNGATTTEALRTIEAHPRFRAEFDAYLARFGDRCMDELKLESATVGEDPVQLLRTVGQMALAPRSGDPGVAKTAARPSAEEKVMQAFRGRPLKGALFRAVLGLARARVRDRENLRFERTRVYGRVRAVFVEIGRRLGARNVLGQADDIFYLDVGEIIAFVRGTGSSAALGDLVATRRREFDAYRAEQDPPRRFITCGPPQLRESRREVAAEAVDTDAMHRTGQGCSPGVVRGPVRIVRDPRHAAVQPGEILVAERTDPGWVTIFPLVSGMIMERGSLLSHSAIVARELGLPCVVGVEDACLWLTDGEWVEIDGAAGTLKRLTRTDQVA